MRHCRPETGKNEKNTEIIAKKVRPPESGQIGRAHRVVVAWPELSRKRAVLNEQIISERFSVQMTHTRTVETVRWPALRAPKRKIHSKRTALVEIWRQHFTTFGAPAAYREVLGH